MHKNSWRANEIIKLMMPSSNLKTARYILKLLVEDNAIWETIDQLHRADKLQQMIGYVFYTEERRKLVEILGRAARLHQSVRGKVEPIIGGGLLELQWQVLHTIERLGVRRPSARFDVGAFKYLVGSHKTSPFSGSGATEINPKDAVIPLADQARLLYGKRYGGQQETIDAYSSPTLNIGQFEYLQTLSQTDRIRQAQLLLRVAVNSVMPEVYGASYPSRAEVIRVAAGLHRLEPEVVGGIILAEQRDQSYNEDAAEYTAAVKKGHDSSIGLGQVVITTATGGREITAGQPLFSDLMSQSTIRNMPRSTVILMLADDTVNIFAVARYIRTIANKGVDVSRISPLGTTHQTFAGLDMSAYSRHSSQ